MTVKVVRDGDSIIALIGPDLQSGIAGTGETTPEALRNFDDRIERTKWPLPGLEITRKPIRVN